MQKITLAVSALAFIAASAALVSPAKQGELNAESLRAALMENPGVIMEALQAAEAKAQEDALLESKTKVAAASDRIYADGFSPVMGNPEGDVTLVMFSDYRCGYCRKAQGELAEILKADPGLKIIVKEYPILGDDSILAARFALAVNDLAGAEAYQQVHDTLFTNPAKIAVPQFEVMAKEMGIDWTTLEARMNSTDISARITATQDLGRELNVQGTPNFVLDGMIIPGVIPKDSLVQAIAKLREPA